MNWNWVNLAASDDPWEGVSNLIIIIVLLVLSALGAIAGKIKEKHERRRAEQEREGRAQEGGARREPAPGRPAPRRVVSVPAEATGRDEAPSPAAGAPAPQARVARLRSTATVVGQPRRLDAGVQRGVARLEQALQAEQARRRRRLEEPPTLRPTIAAAPSEGDEQAKVGLEVDLDRSSEALRAIVYLEILGPPKSLRGGPEPWER